MSRPVLVLLFTSVLWGASWIPLKSLYAAGFGGISLIFLSFGLLALLLTPVLFFQRAHWQPYIPRLLLVALLGGAASLTFAYALIYGDVIRVMVLFYLLPIWGALGGHFLLSEKIDCWRWLAVILAVSGAFIILGAFHILQQPPSWIDLISIAAGFLLAMTILSFRAIQQIPVICKIAAMFYGCFIFAGLTLLFTAESLVVGNTIISWVGLIAYAIAWLLVANLGSQWAVTNIETSRASIIIILELITAVVSAAIIRGETMAINEMAGGIIILAAALMEALRETQEN